MGAENSVLEGCDWGDKLPCPNGVQWNITPVTKKDGMEGVVFQPKNSDKKDNNLLQKSAKMLKGLRHPNIVRYLGCGTFSDGFWLATEPVSPLLAVVNDVGLTSYELVIGVWDIIQALDFLHSKLGVCHNNISASSIYVSKDGSWKLAGMEHACKFLEATPEFLESTRAFRNEDALAPEEKTGRVKLDMSTAHAKDVFALGALVDSLTDVVRDRNDNTIAELEKQLTPCVSSDPSSRPTTSTLIRSSVFRSDFIEIIAFIKNVTVKTEEQKNTFFSSLLPKLRQLPEEVIARKLVQPLLSRFVLLDEAAEREVAPSLLTPFKDNDDKDTANHPDPTVVGLLSESIYRLHVIPHLCNVFRVHDCHIRLVLLEHFQHYVHLFSREQLEEDIFLQILLGIRDTDDRLVAASLRALADLVPLMGGDFVIGGSRKCFFFHGIPKPMSAEDIQSLSSSTPNVTSILTPPKHSPAHSHPPFQTKADPNHKPLLKDLAYGIKSGNRSSMTTTTSSEEKERKMREREQRREEARLKREERRMKAKTKHANNISADDNTGGDKKGSNSDNTSTLLTIERVAALDREEKLTSGDEKESFQEDDVKKVDTDEERDDDEMYAPETEGKADWSDWEDADGNYSDEIEEELKKLSSAKILSRNNSNSSDSKLQTSPSPYQNEDTLERYPSPPTVSHHHEATTTTTTTTTTKGPLSLGRNKADTHKISEGSDNNFVNGTLESSSPAVGAKALKIKNLNSSASSTASSVSNSSNQSGKSKSITNSKPKKVSNDLGLGYDIKSIEIKSKSAAQADDLFADMAPVISSTTSADPVKDMLAATLGNVDSTKDSLKTSKQTKPVVSNTAMFAVDSTSQENQEGGWEDDDGWGADDF